MNKSKKSVKINPFERPIAPTEAIIDVLASHHSKPMPAFVTGSYAYGTPTEDSDIDLVVFIENESYWWLHQNSEDDGTPLDYLGNVRPLRFGNINIIPVETPEQYEVWRKGTLELQRRAPVTRDEACDTFLRIEQEMGVQRHE